MDIPKTLPYVTQLENAVENLLGIVDTPVARRKLPLDDMGEEAIKEARKLKKKIMENREL